MVSRAMLLLLLWFVCAEALVHRGSGKTAEADAKATTKDEATKEDAPAAEADADATDDDDAEVKAEEEAEAEEQADTKVLEETKEEAEPAKKEEAKPAKKEEAKPAKKELAKPAKKEEAKPAKKENDAKPVTIVDLPGEDQPEFDKASGGDECVSLADGRKLIANQYHVSNADRSSLTRAERRQRHEEKKKHFRDGQILFKHGDKNKDGCLDRAEFKELGDTGVVPADFEESMKAIFGIKAFQKRVGQLFKSQYEAFDRNGDHKLSQAEAKRFVVKTMPFGDHSINNLRKLFAAADTDKDNSISFNEFLVIAPKIKAEAQKFDEDMAEPQTIPEEEDEEPVLGN